MPVQRPQLAALFLSGSLLASQAQPPAPEPAPRPAPAQEAEKDSPIHAHGKLLDVDVDRMDIVQFLKNLAERAGAKVIPVGYLPMRISLKETQATFEEVLKDVCLNAGITFKKGEDGAYNVGYASDLLVAFSDPNDTTEVEITYRCRQLSADSLANVLTKAFPNIKAITGPLFLSPSLESTANTSLSDSVKALGAVDVSFKTHDVLISGPVNQVKRALVLARKFDRNRKQVRINAKLTEMSTSDTRDLGINWTMPSYSLQEIPDPNATDKSVKGIKFGSFSHNLSAIGASIQALEKKGRVNTLANPSISVLDGERSFILIGERRLYPKQTGVNSQGLPIFDVAEVKTGVYLQVAVQIGLNNDMVMTVYPQVSSVTSTVLIGQSQYPIIATREAQTTVQLRSGDVLAIGGLISQADNKDRTRTPLLGWIPLIGEIFTSHSTVKQQSELVLFITPEIIENEGTSTITVDGGQ